MPVVSVDETPKAAAVTSSTAPDVEAVDVATDPTLEDFAWSDVTYGIGKGKKSKEILPAPGISGSVCNGDLCALIGPSGAGKTSLLDVLAQRKRNRGPAQRVSGSITLGGKPLEGGELRKRIAFVAQSDLHYATETVREALMFSATLRLPAKVPKETLAKLVDGMITDLGLTRCADTIIGNDRLRGVSGGEKKRVSVGVELVMQPSLIFLDEPTSGLDSFSAYAVVSKLKDLAVMHNCKILCTIHQPSSEVFAEFNKVVMLRTGRVVYNGPVAGMQDAFGAAGFPCPEHYNPCDHAMNVIQSKMEDEDEFKRITAKLAETVASMKPKAATNDLAEASVSQFKAVRQESKVDLTSGASRQFAAQLSALAAREWRGLVRNKPGLIAFLVIPIILFGFFGLIFMGVGDVNSSTYTPQAQFGGITQIAIGGLFSSAQPLIIRFPLDRNIFLREYSTATYSAVAYLLSGLTVELVKGFINALCVWLVSYWTMGFHGSFFNHVLIFWLSGATAAGTAQLVGCLAADAETASRASPIIFTPQLLFAGFFLPASSIPVALRWVSYICSLKYAVNLHIINEFGDAASWADNATVAIIDSTIIDANDIYTDQWWVYLLVLLLLFVGFRFIALVALVRKASNSF